MSSWYSQKQLLLFLGFFFWIVIGVSWVTPPLQLPDEPNHLKRAYLLSKGRIFLETRDGVTGGLIDKGFLEFENSFSYLRSKSHIKVDPGQLEESKKIRWQGSADFSPLPNTAVYFPISYVPQAIGLFVGEQLDLTIYQSYLICRVLCLLIALGIIYCSSIFYPIPPLALACLLVPMSIFQLGSASLDPISYALCFLIAATFSRMHQANERFSLWTLFIFATSLLFFITTRINFVPLALIPITMYWYQKRKVGLFVAMGIFGLAITCSLYVLLTVKGVQVDRTLGTLEIIQQYLNDPWRFMQVLLTTFSKWGLMRQYWEQFVGQLGWLDTKIYDLGGVTYIIYFGIFVYIAYLTRVQFSKLQKEQYRLFSDLLIMVCWLALFAILLFAWTKHPTNSVDGIQGRYFTPFVILAAYINFDQLFDRVIIKKVTISLSVLLSVSITIIIPTLQNRYWY